MAAIEPSEFRDRLIDAQPMTPTLRDEYRTQLDALLHHKLTPQTRRLTWAGLLGCVAFAVACVSSFVLHHTKPGGTKFVLPLYSAIFVAAAVWLGRVLRQNGFSRRSSFAVVEWLGGSMVGVYVTAVLLGSMRSPADPASSYSAIWAVMFMMVGFAWATGSRITAATLETREHLLRIESRLADLNDRVTQAR
jgi:peptidoglycan/LPS O-acetylase OafA/YrhL